MAYNPGAGAIMKRMLGALRGKGVNPYDTGPARQVPHRSKVEKSVAKPIHTKGVDPYDSHPAQSAAYESAEGINPFEALKRHHDHYHAHAGKDHAKAVGHSAMYHKTLGSLAGAVPAPQDLVDNAPPAAPAVPAAPEPQGYDPYNSADSMAPPGMVPTAPRIKR